MTDNNNFDEKFIECEKGCVLNFLEHTDKDGRIPIVIALDSSIPELDKEKEANIHKPCLAQHIGFIIREDNGDASWMYTHFDKLKAFVQYYTNNYYHKETGLYYCKTDAAIGVDNDPCTFYRPL